MTTISTSELRDRLDDPNLTIVDVRPLVAYNGWRRGAAVAAATCPAPSPSRSPGSISVDEVEIERLLDSKGVTAGRDIVVYGDSAAEAATFVTKLEHARHRGRPDLRGRRRRVGRRRVAAARPSPELRQAGRHRVAPRGPRRRAAGGGAHGQVPALPRQLRRARGVRRGAHPGRALPRHQLAGGPGRLEPPVAGGDHRGAARASASPTTRRSSCTAATPKVRPTRSGPAGAPARSPRRGR